MFYWSDDARKCILAETDHLSIRYSWLSTAFVCVLYKYVILFAFQLQQLFRERVSVLRYTYIAGLVEFRHWSYARNDCNLMLGMTPSCLYTEGVPVTVWVGLGQCGSDSAVWKIMSGYLLILILILHLFYQGFSFSVALLNIDMVSFMLPEQTLMFV